jgi:RimJ/RimL family protein N-acetyltransferase
MKNHFTTKRLVLNPLNLSDKSFIFDLLNTEGFIKFIGDRNIKTDEDALNYCQKIMDNPTISYWVVKLKKGLIPIGIISFIKRDYLEYHDIGFAFLPDYAKKGYAFEAASTVLNEALRDVNHRFILATTIKDNINSIKLLEKLGLQFDKEISVGTDNLWMYSVIRDTI